MNDPIAAALLGLAGFPAGYIAANVGYAMPKAAWPGKGHYPPAALVRAGIAGAILAGVSAGLALSPGDAVIAALAGFVLLTLSITDQRTFLIPDILSLPLIPAAMLGRVLVADQGDMAPVLGQSIAGAAAGYFLFRFVIWAYRRVRGHDGMGMGDAKLLAGSGALVGLGGLASVILYGAVSALVTAVAMTLGRGRLSGKLMLPFGPHLALATFIVMLSGPAEAWLTRLILPH